MHVAGISSQVEVSNVLSTNHVFGHKTLMTCSLVKALVNQMVSCTAHPLVIRADVSSKIGGFTFRVSDFMHKLNELGHYQIYLCYISVGHQKCDSAKLCSSLPSVETVKYLLSYTFL